MDWERVRLTEHMTEAAAVVAEGQVVFAFPPAEQVVYEVKVHRVLKGGGAPFFAVGLNRQDPGGFRPLGEGGTPEEAVQTCLENAGVYHRRRARQAGA